MNILMIINHSWPEGSGGSLATYLITKLLARDRSFNTTIITGTKNPAKVNNVEFIVDPTLRASSKVELLLRLTNPVVRRRYEKLIKGFDILYIPSYSSCGYPLIPVAKKLGKKVIVHLHDYQPLAYNSVILANQRGDILTDISYEARYEIYEYGDVKRAILGSIMVPITNLYRLWMRQANTIICVSRRQAEIVAEKAPELRHKIKVIYNPPANVPPIEKRLGEPTFLYLGGDSYIKGFYVFLDATQRFLKQYFEAKFLLAGNFKDSSKLIFEKLNKRFNGAYSLLGYLKHEDILRFHKRSYALLFPSICEEPLPYAVLESMLAGTIPIASRVGGIPEVVGGTPAEKLMFMYGNVDEFIDRIELVLSMSKEQLINVEHQLREAVLRKYNNERIKQELLKVFAM